MDLKQLIVTFIIVLGITAMPLASANQSNWYVGAGTGSSDIDDSALDDDSGTKFYGGWHFTKRYALEGGYTDLGSFDIDTVPGADVEVDGIQVAGVASFPLKGRVAIFGKAGLYSWDSEVSIAGFDDDGTDVMYGFGVSFGAGNWAVRGEWERFDADDDIDLLSVGVVYRR